jgi:hypothetical protein
MAKRKKDAISKRPDAATVAKKKPARFKASAEEARTRTAKVKETFATMGKLWWELGAEVKACIDDFVPEALGRKATEWMKECFGDAWLKVYRAHRAIASLPGVPKAKLEKISEGNAYQLARLPAKVRKEPAWIDKAIKLSNENFKEVVEKAREKKGVKRDPMVKWQEIFGIASVPKTLADLIKHALEMAIKAEDGDPDQKEGRINGIELIFSEFVTSQAQPGEIVVEQQQVQQGEGQVESDEIGQIMEETYGDPLPEGTEIAEVQPAEQREYVNEDASEAEVGHSLSKKRRKRASAA